MKAAAKFQAHGDGSLSREMLDSYVRNGFLVLADFWSAETCQRVMERAEHLAETVDRPEQSAAFSTTSRVQDSDSYFKDSGGRIAVFFEEGMGDQDGRAVNKLGHAMHDLDPVFEQVSRDPRLAQVCHDLAIADPGLVQSMVIFKRPHVGGEVTAHQDSTFLHTTPTSVVGLWFALEDATVQNGCLYAVPGAHEQGLKQRYHYSGEALVMDDLRDGEESWELSQAVPLEASAGSLVILHGLLPHFSGANTSAKSRMAYTLHVIDQKAKWSDDNWLRRAEDMPVRGF